MFSKTSRYRQLPDIVTVDARGQSAESKTLRLLPDVTGTFRHTLGEGERLDHLAYKYYRQPGQWWRICDADPDVSSPRALLGNEPVVTYRWPLGTGGQGDRPPWSELLRQVGEVPGVEDVAAEEIEIQPAEVGETADHEPVYAARFERALVVRFNRMSTSLEEIDARLESVAMPTGPPSLLGRVGQPITIPPRPAGRRS